MVAWFVFNGLSLHFVAEVFISIIFIKFSEILLKFIPNSISTYFSDKFHLFFWNISEKYPIVVLAYFSDKFHLFFRNISEKYPTWVFDQFFR